MLILGKLLSLFGGTANSIIKNRLLNKKTPAGILLAVAGIYGVTSVTHGEFNKEEVEFIISILSGVNLSFFNITIIIIGFIALFFIAMGLWLVFAKVKHAVEEISHPSNNTNESK